MSIFKRALGDIKENKRKREAGEIIAIPFPFKRFSKFIPGIQKRRYIICTANTKVGKTKFADFMFMYGPLDYILKQKKKGKNFGIDVRINYFCLEMSKEDKIKEAISYYLYTTQNVVLPPDKMDSIFEDSILSDGNLIKIEELKEIFEFFESKVTFHDNVRNPWGIYKEMRKVAHANGYYVDKNGNKLDTKKIEKGEENDEEWKKIDHYVQKDPNVYYITMIDHFSLLMPEKKHRQSGNPLREAIKDFSANRCLSMRDRWGHTVVGIQQQANAQESVDNFKSKKLRPSGAGLADCKDTQRDVDMMIGLFAPNRHDIGEWNNYDIETLGDFYRELTIIINRRGSAVGTNLWFNGASNFFAELPRYDDSLNMAQVYKETNQIRNLN